MTDGTIEGVVSLTDIFSFILHSTPPKAENRIAALKQDLEQNANRELEQNLNIILARNPVTTMGAGAGGGGGGGGGPGIGMGIGIGTPLSSVGSPRTDVPMGEQDINIDPEEDYLR